MAEVIVKKGGCQIIKDSPSEYRLVKPGGLTIRCTSEAFAKEEMEKCLKKQESHGFSNGRAKALAVITNKAEAIGVRLENAEGDVLSTEEAKKIGAEYKRAGKTQAQFVSEYKVNGYSPKGMKVLQAWKEGYNT